MKKLVLAIAVVLGTTLVANAQGGGLFGKGPDRESASYDVYDEAARGNLIALPSNHGSSTDTDAPLGSGIAVLIGFGAAYAMSKKGKK